MTSLNKTMFGNGKKIYVPEELHISMCEKIQKHPILKIFFSETTNITKVIKLNLSFT